MNRIPPGVRYLRNPARTVTAASLKTEEAIGVNGQTDIALKIHFVSTAAHHFGDGSLGDIVGPPNYVHFTRNCVAKVSQ